MRISDSDTCKIGVDLPIGVRLLHLGHFRTVETTFLRDLMPELRLVALRSSIPSRSQVKRRSEASQPPADPGIGTDFQQEMTMTKLSLSALLAFVLAAPAFAQAMVEDTDGDGAYSLEEMVSAMPDLSVEVFDEIDTNDDGFVDPEEFTAAEQAGLIAG